MLLQKQASIIWRLGFQIRFIVFNATFNNISVISTVLLVEETGVPIETTVLSEVTD
jgi:hypothetical protein